MWLSICRGAASAALVAGCLLSFAGPAKSQSEQPSDMAAGIDERQVVATVNGEEIHFAQLMLLVNSLPEQYRSIPLPIIYPELLRQLVNQRLIADAAEAENYLEDPEIRDRLAFVQQRILQDAYFSQEIEETLTEERLRARYDERMRDMQPQEEIRARHILVESEEEAEEVIQELSEGAEFAELAKTRSTGPSGPTGGDLGFFTKEQMVPEFAEAAFALDVGAYTREPVQTTYGWHVILLEERRQQEPPSFEESREEIRNELAGEMVSDIITGLRDGAAIEEFNIDGSPLESSE